MKKIISIKTAAAATNITIPAGIRLKELNARIHRRRKIVTFGFYFDTKLIKLLCVDFKIVDKYCKKKYLYVYVYMIISHKHI